MLLSTRYLVSHLGLHRGCEVSEQKVTISVQAPSHWGSYITLPWTNFPGWLSSAKRECKRLLYDTQDIYGNTSTVFFYFSPRFVCVYLARSCYNLVFFSLFFFSRTIYHIRLCFYPLPPCTKSDPGSPPSLPLRFLTFMVAFLLREEFSHFFPLVHSLLLISLLSYAALGKNVQGSLSFHINISMLPIFSVTRTAASQPALKVKSVASVTIAILPIPALSTTTTDARRAGNPLGVRHISRPPPPSVLDVSRLAGDADQSPVRQNARR